MWVVRSSRGCDRTFDSSQSHPPGPIIRTDHSWGVRTPRSLDVGDEHLGVVPHLPVDGNASDVQVKPGVVVVFEQHQQLQRQPLLEVHQLPCVARCVLPVGLVQLDPDGVPDVERQDAVGAELPQSVGLRQHLVGVPQGDAARLVSGVPFPWDGRLRDDALPLRLGLRCGSLTRVMGTGPTVGTAGRANGITFGQNTLQPARERGEHSAPFQHAPQSFQRHLAVGLVALVASSLVLAFEQLPADLVVPGEDGDVEHVERRSAHEAGPLGRQLDVLGVDHAFEVPRAESLERCLDLRDLQLPAARRVEREVTPRDRVVVVGTPDEHDAASNAAVLWCAVEFERDGATLLLVVGEHLQLLSGEPDGVDLARLGLAVLVDQHHEDAGVLAGHADAQLGPDVTFEFVQVGEVLDLVLVDVDHVDDRAPPRVELAGDLHELSGQQRECFHCFPWDLPVFVHLADDRTLEAPDVSHPLTQRMAGEREVLALTERRDQAEAEASETTGPLDALTDTLQCLPELLSGHAGAVVQDEDLTRSEVDPDEHLLRVRVDCVLGRLGQHERQARVRVGETEQGLAQVETQVVFVRRGSRCSRTCVFGAP